MDTTNYGKFLLPIRERQNANLDSDNISYSQDYVSLMTIDEFLSLPKSVKQINPTDYAKLIGFSSQVDSSQSCDFLSDGACGSVNKVQEFAPYYSDVQSIRPVVKLGLSSNYTSNSQLDLNSQEQAELDSIIKRIKTETIDGKECAFLELGAFPQTYVGEKLNNELEYMFILNKDKGLLNPINRVYAGENGLRPAPFYHQEFEYYGERYVRVHSRNLSAVTMSDSQLVSSLDNQSGFWVKVEPVKYYILNWDSLPKTINPNGNGKDNFVKIVSQNTIMTSIPTFFEEIDSHNEDWEDSRIVNYLNGRYSSKNGKRLKDYSFSGGFLGESLNLTRSRPSTYLLPDDVEMIRKNTFFGCSPLSRIIIKDTRAIYRSIYNLKDLGLKFFYQNEQMGYDFVAQNLHLKNKLVYNYDELETYFNGYDFYKVSDLFSNSWQEKLLPKLKKNNYPINYNIIDFMPREDALEFANHSNFVFAGDMLNELRKIFPTGTVVRVFQSRMIHFMMGLGCFSDKKIVDKNGKETDTFLAQKACSFFLKLCQDDYYYDAIYSLKTDSVVNPSQDFLAFLMVKDSNGNYENFDLLLKLTDKYPDIFAVVMKDFSSVKKFRKGINEKGVPFTRSWEKTILSFYLANAYEGINDSNKDIAEEFLQRGIEERVFEISSELREQALMLGTRHNILDKPIKEETIMQTVERVRSQTELELSQAEKMVEDAFDKYYTFEFLDKYDPKNFIIGLLVDCCCTVSGIMYGAEIAKQTITNDRVQNLVLRDAHNDIVGKATFYVNEYSEAVINEFDLKESYRTVDGKRNALKTFIRGIKAFIREYDLEHPDDPLRKVNVGLGYNKLTKELTSFPDEKEHMFVRTPEEIKFEDSLKEQKKIYDRRFDTLETLDDLENEI